MTRVQNTLFAQADTFSFERDLLAHGYECIAGVDEVGRGPLAGPVVAACVQIPQGCDHTPFQDSKKTTLRQRVQLAGLLHQYRAPIGIGIVSHEGIDRMNILQASLMAMKLAVFHFTSLFQAPHFLLVDGKFAIPLDTPQLPLIKGDSRSASIAAASIVAKLQRDAILDNLHNRFPQYGFNRHKGYPTKIHRTAIARYGPCPVHRKTFHGVAEYV